MVAALGDEGYGPRCCGKWIATSPAEEMVLACKFDCDGVVAFCVGFSGFWSIHFFCTAVKCISIARDALSVGLLVCAAGSNCCVCGGDFVVLFCDKVA